MNGKQLQRSQPHDLFPFQNRKVKQGTALAPLYTLDNFAVHMAKCKSER